MRPALEASLLVHGCWESLGGLGSRRQVFCKYLTAPTVSCVKNAPSLHLEARCSSAGRLTCSLCPLGGQLPLRRRPEYQVGCWQLSECTAVLEIPLRCPVSQPRQGVEEGELDSSCWPRPSPEPGRGGGKRGGGPAELAGEHWAFSPLVGWQPLG